MSIRNYNWDHFILCDVAPYFKECVSEQDLDEIHIEIIRNTLFKTYLEDFYKFCKGLGGTTAEVMGMILEVEPQSTLTISNVLFLTV